MNSWELGTIDLKPRLPEILSSSDAARAIVLDLAAGESLSEHEVHERSWLVVLGGEIEVAAAAGECASGGSPASDKLRAILDDRAARAANYASLALVLAILVLMVVQ